MWTTWRAPTRSGASSPDWSIARRPPSSRYPSTWSSRSRWPPAGGSGDDTILGLRGVDHIYGDGGVNVEDVRVDHVPGRPRGVIGLLVREQARPQAEAVLRAAGWDVLQR